MKWWEKTVEYFFVLKHVKIDMLVSPLDGTEEKLGDAILSDDNKWVLIEFKKDKNKLNSEKEKFDDYDKAQEQLCEKDNHHYLIYGEFNGEFQLKCITYFSAKERDSIESALSMGTDIESFGQYIEEFTELKNSPNDGGGGGLGLSDYSLVAGVNDNGDIIQCMSISDFQQIKGHDPKPEKRKELKYRSMGR